jgi:hypothetical protein
VPDGQLAGERAQVVLGEDLVDQPIERWVMM